jgi:hypothetical protein
MGKIRLLWCRMASDAQAGGPADRQRSSCFDSDGISPTGVAAAAMAWLGEVATRA